MYHTPMPPGEGAQALSRAPGLPWPFPFQPAPSASQRRRRRFLSLAGQFTPDEAKDAIVVLADFLDSNETGNAVEFLIARFDAMGGDPDIEANGDELDDSGDARDSSWPEGSRVSDTTRFTADSEDDEQDDHGEEDDHSGELYAEDAFDLVVRSQWGETIGAGCPLADPGEHDAREQGVPRYGRNQARGPIDRRNRPWPGFPSVKRIFPGGVMA